MRPAAELQAGLYNVFSKGYARYRDVPPFSVAASQRKWESFERRGRKDARERRSNDDVEKAMDGFFNK